MPRRWLAIFFAAALVAVATAGVLVLNRSHGQKMQEIKFELGRNIVETARESGVPKFQARDVAGLVSYSVDGIPREIPAHYARPGYEVRWQPVFAFTMYSDRDRNAALPVETAVLQLHADFTTDEAAQAFTEQTVAQFQKGKWKRYADPEWDVLLTGRSSYLDEAGQVSSSATGAPDPAYKIPKEDWPTVASSLHLRWIGDGVVAELTVNNSPGVDGKPAYRMGIEFELLDAMLKRDAANGAQKRKEGDAKGWNSTNKYEAGKKARAEEMKRLIANALKRGDAVVPVP
jgi:hypothetical protein